MTVDVERVADGVWFARTDLVNWVVLTDASGITLIDCGYPGHRREVDESVRAAGGELDDVRALLVTHAHVDHIGSAQQLADEHGVTVYVHPAEAAHARRETHHAATPAQVVANLWRRGVATWLRAAMRVGVTSKAGIDAPSVLPEASPLPVPGSPVAVATPGHTPGHTAYFLPAAGVVATGDGLVTAHPTSRYVGPQMLLPMFDDDRAAAVAALHPLTTLDADIMLPGHGPVHRGPISSAADDARRRAG